MITGSTLVQQLDAILTVSPSYSIWFDIGVIIIIAALFALIARLLRQPSIPAYIIAGVIIGPIGLGIIKNTEVITVLSEIGIAFLLFFAGLEISFKKIKDVTKVAILGGIGQIVVIGLITTLIAMAFSFPKSEFIFLALAISFSSTAIVVKLLADKNQLNTLHARITIGMLLLQDIIAVIALSALSTKTISLYSMAAPLFKILLISLFAFIVGKTILNPLFVFAAYSIELLFLSSIAVCFLFSLLALVPLFGLPSLSIAIGSFIGGVLLANSPFKLEIESKILSLRDFFITIFFVSTGMRIVFSGIGQWILPFICFTAVVVIVEPYVTMIILRFFGYTKKTAFFTGFYQAQTSEFSLILMAQGLALGFISQTTFSMIVLITVITMSITPFFITHEKFFFERLSFFLNIFRNLKEKADIDYETKSKKDIVLFGCHRMGSIFLRALSKAKDRTVVIDVDPDITRELTRQKVPNIYGDMADPNILDKIDFSEIKLAISTVPDKIDNLYIIERIKKENKNAMIFVTSDFISDALELYEKGADYVILPQTIAGEKCISLLKEIADKKRTLNSLKKEQIEHLKQLDYFTYDIE